jgi:DNA-binding transcriptional ArsR family regulator
MPASRSRDTFGALADPTRRQILELLLDRHELTAGAVAGAFPDLSRPAVSKHLGVLRDAGLVQAREEGREVFYALDPTPLEAAHREFWARFAPLWDARLTRLKHNAERVRSPRR